jgi:hypothetical protein
VAIDAGMETQIENAKRDTKITFKQVIALSSLVLHRTYRCKLVFGSSPLVLGAIGCLHKYGWCISRHARNG